MSAPTDPADDPTARKSRFVGDQSEADAILKANEQPRQLTPEQRAALDAMFGKGKWGPPPAASDTPTD